VSRTDRDREGDRVKECVRETDTPEDETLSSARSVCVWCVHCFIIIITIIVNNRRTMFSVTTTISVACVRRRRLVKAMRSSQSRTSRTTVCVKHRCLKTSFDFSANRYFSIRHNYIFASLYSVGICSYNFYNII